MPADPPADLLLDVPALLRQIEELVPRSTILVYDRELRIVAAAGSRLSRHGWSADQVRGKLLAELVTPAFLEIVGPHLKAALDGGRSEVEYTSPETGRSYLQSFAPLHGREGAGGPAQLGITRWVETTDVRRMERDLAQSEERYRLITERSSDVTIVFGRDLASTTCRRR